MGAETVHYVVYGDLIKDPKDVSEFFKRTERNPEGLDLYDDNPYQEEITPTKSGIHIISDGMSGEYVVVGVIKDKSQHQLRCEAHWILSKDAYLLNEKIKELDQLLDFNFSSLPQSVIVLSHVH